ncbi:MAG: HAD family hydrolase, partial [Clostridia bacterium]
MKDLLRMGYKLLVCDFDDTLAKRDKTVSDITVAAIKQYQLEGGAFCICSGRALPSIKKQAAKIGIDCFYIGCHGAVTANEKGEILERREMSCGIAIETLKLLSEFDDIFIMIYYRDEIFANRKCEYSDNYTKISSCPISICDDLIKKVKNEQLTLQKILVIDEPEKIKYYYKKCDGRFSPHIQVSGSQSNFMEIVHMDSRKGEAVKELAKILNIDIEKTVAVGDSAIDISMIESAGLGVAVKNATEDTKIAANVVLKFT